MADTPPLSVGETFSAGLEQQKQYEARLEKLKSLQQMNLVQLGDARGREEAAGTADELTAGMYRELEGQKLGEILKGWDDPSVDENAILTQFGDGVVNGTLPESLKDVVKEAIRVKIKASEDRPLTESLVRGAKHFPTGAKDVVESMALSTVEAMKTAGEAEVSLAGMALGKLSGDKQLEEDARILGEKAGARVASAAAASTYESSGFLKRSLPQLYDMVVAGAYALGGAGHGSLKVAEVATGTGDAVSQAKDRKAGLTDDKALDRYVSSRLEEEKYLATIRKGDGVVSKLIGADVKSLKDRGIEYTAEDVQRAADMEEMLDLTEIIEFGTGAAIVSKGARKLTVKTLRSVGMNKAANAVQRGVRAAAPTTRVLGRAVRTTEQVAEEARKYDSTIRKLRVGLGRKTVALGDKLKNANIPASSSLLVGGAVMANGGDVKDAGVAMVSTLAAKYFLGGRGGIKLAGRGVSATGRAIGATFAENSPWEAMRRAAMDISSDIKIAAAAGLVESSAFALDPSLSPESRVTLLSSGLVMAPGGAITKRATDWTSNALRFGPRLSTPNSLAGPRVDPVRYGNTAVDTRNRESFSKLDESSTRYLRSLQELLGDSGGLHVVLSQEEARALAVELSNEKNKGSAANMGPSQGVSLTPDQTESGKPEAIVIIDQSGTSESSGHEVTHAIFAAIEAEGGKAAESLTAAREAALKSLGGVNSPTFRAIKQHYSELQKAAGLGLDVTDQYALDEWLAEHGSVVLTGVPLGKLGADRGIVYNIYDALLTFAEEMQLRVPGYAPDGTVPVTSNTLPFSPSVNLLNQLENIFTAFKLERDPIIEGPPLPPRQEAGESAPVEPAKPQEKVNVGVSAPVPSELLVDPQSPYNPEGVTGEANITPEAAALLDSLDTGAGVPAFISKRLEKIAKDNGITVDRTTTPAGIVQQLRDKQVRSGAVKAPTDGTPVATPTAAPVVGGVTEAQRQAVAGGVASPELQTQNEAKLEAGLNTPFEVEYQSAEAPVDEKTDAATRLRQRELADSAETEGELNPLRKGYGKVVTPLFTYKRSGGGVNVIGFSVDKLIRNMNILRGWLKEQGNPSTANKLFSPEFTKDIENYTTNQQNGYRGDGERIVRPEGTDVSKYPPENKNYTPVSVSESSRNLINVLMGLDPVSSKSALSAWVRQLAELNGFSVTAEVPGKSAPKVFFNPLMAELMKAGFDPALLHSTIENLRVERMTTAAKARPDLSSLRPSVQGSVQAGFMPAQQPTGTGLEFRKFFSSVTKGTFGKSKVPFVPVIEMDEELHPVIITKDSHSGNFDDHISKSIPTFYEAQIGTIEALSKLPEGSVVLDIAASEGSWGKAVTQQSGGNVSTVSLDPNEDMAHFFKIKSTVEGATYSTDAFLNGFEDGGVTVKAYNPTERFDAIHESMGFQFIDPDRAAQVAEVKRLMKPDGIFLTEEKLKNDDWKANEVTKDTNHKSKYFTKEELKAKDDVVGFAQSEKEEMAVGMVRNMASVAEYESTLKDNFEHVYQYWDSGNFKGYVASDSKTAVDSFLSNLPSLNSEFSTVKTPTESFMPLDSRENSAVTNFKRDAKNLRNFTMEAGAKKLNASGFDRRFHINTVVGRIMENLDTTSIERVIGNLTRDGKTDRAEVWEERRKRIQQVAPFIFDAISSLTDKLPKDEARDLRSGEAMDPYEPLRKNFTGGSAMSADAALSQISSALESLDDIFSKIGSRDILNLAELVRDAAGLEVSKATMDRLFMRDHDLTEAEVQAADKKALEQITNIEFNDVSTEGGVTTSRRIPDFMPPENMDEAGAQHFDKPVGPFMPAMDDSGFYSKMEQVVNQKLAGRTATLDQLKAVLDPQRGSGIKPDEIKWSGIIPYIERLAIENGGKIPMDAVRAYMANEGKLKFEEVTLSAADSYVDPVQMAREKAARDANDEQYFMESIDPNAVEDFDSLSEEARFEINWELFGVEYTERAKEEIKRRQEVGGEPQYNQPNLTIPNGEKYREVVLTSPSLSSMSSMSMDEAFEKWKEDARAGRRGYYTESEIASMKIGDIGDILIMDYINGPTTDYRSSHYRDVPDYVAHMRLNERNDSAGNAGLFIEEIQSDRHQAGRKNGYNGKEQRTLYRLRNTKSQNGGPWVESKEDAEAQLKSLRDRGVRIAENIIIESRVDTGSETSVPDAPFRKDWGLQLFKRALRDAVASGKEWVGWTDGATQAARYDLSQQVESIELSDVQEKGRRVIVHIDEDTGTAPYAMNVDNNGVIESTPIDGMRGKKLEDVIGKEMAAKIMGATERTTFKGDDLKVGGEGMKGFYDTMLPKEVGKYVRQWGAKVEQGYISHGEKVGTASEGFKIELAEGNLYYVTKNGEPVSEGFENWDAANDSITTSQVSSPIWKVNISDPMRDSISNVGQTSYMPRRKEENASPSVRPLSLEGVKIQHQSDPKEGSMEGPQSLVHFSSVEMKILNPKKSSGKGAATPVDLRGSPRGYFYRIGESAYEDNIASRPYIYTAVVDGNSIYDLNSDPLNYNGTLNKLKADQMLVKAGYVGMRGFNGTTDMVAMFKAVRVEPATVEDVYTAKQLKAQRAPRKPLSDVGSPLKPLAPLEDIDYTARDAEWDSKQNSYMPPEGKIKWDRQEGLGNFAYQKDIKYFGFQKLMLPSEFRSLVPSGVSGEGTTAHVLEQVKQGKPIAPPYLEARWDEEKSAWEVTGHEGRSRTDAAAILEPTRPVAVSIKVSPGRARNLTSEQMNAPLITQGKPNSSPKQVGELYTPEADNNRYMPKATTAQESEFAKSTVRDTDGKLKPLFHYTSADFKRFGKGDLGYHFGTEEQAQFRALYPESKKLTYPPREGARTIPVFLNLENPLRTKDIGPWNDPEEVLFGLPRKMMRELPEAILKEVDKYVAWTVQYVGLMKDFESARESRAQAALASIREGLKGLGYDGVVYKNEFESATTEEDSYIAFDNDQIMPAFTDDVSARFMPSSKAGEMGSTVELTEDMVNPYSFMPVARVNLEDYIGQDVVTITTDRLATGKVGDSRPLAREAQGGRGFPLTHDGLGWAFSNEAAASRFLARIKVAEGGSTALVATAVLGEANVLNSPFGQYAVAMAYRNAVDMGQLNERTVNRTIKQIFQRASEAAGSDVNLAKIKTLAEYEKATEAWPFSFGATSHVASRLDAATLPISTEARTNLKLDKLAIARSISDKELAGLPNFSLVSLMEIDKSQTPKKTDVHFSYPWTVKGKLVGFFNTPYLADTLLTASKLRNQRGELSAQPMMLGMPSIGALKPSEINPNPEAVLQNAKITQRPRVSN